MKHVETLLIRHRCNGSCETLISGMREKFQRGELTDVIVRYGDEFQHSKQAHRLVLCASSKFFNNALHKHTFKARLMRLATI